VSGSAILKPLPLDEVLNMAMSSAVMVWVPVGGPGYWSPTRGGVTNQEPHDKNSGLAVDSGVVFAVCYRLRASVGVTCPAVKDENRTSRSLGRYIPPTTAAGIHAETATLRAEVSACDEHAMSMGSHSLWGLLQRDRAADSVAVDNSRFTKWIVWRTAASTK